jgi:putative ABC transport system permease protein
MAQSAGREAEIGTRKVLVVNVSRIIMIINKDFLWLIIITGFIASPSAWYASNKWLQDFVYRINIDWWDKPDKDDRALIPDSLLS